MKYSKRVCFFIYFFIFGLSSLRALPIEGTLEVDQKKVATFLVYPRYVELIDTNKNLIAKAGIMLDGGKLSIFIIKENGLEIIGYAIQNQLFDLNDQRIAFYQSDRFYSYIYSNANKLQGRTKCLAWQELCAAIGSAFLNGQIE